MKQKKINNNNSNVNLNLQAEWLRSLLQLQAYDGSYEDIT